MPDAPTSDLTATLIAFASTYGPLLSAGAIVFSALLGAGVAIVAIINQRDVARKRATIETILWKIWDKDYIAIRRKFVELRGNRNDLLEAAKEANQAGENASTIRSILNDYEITALGIKRNILDEGLFKLWWRSTFLKDCSSMRTYIEEVRQRNPRAFKELEELAEKWTKESNNESH